MQDPDAQVSEVLAAWRLDIDSEPFVHQTALNRAARRWTITRRWVSCAGLRSLAGASRVGHFCRRGGDLTSCGDQGPSLLDNSLFGLFSWAHPSA
jgi:hypothetical protein